MKIKKTPSVPWKAHSLEWEIEWATEQPFIHSEGVHPSIYSLRKRLDSPKQLRSQTAGTEDVAGQVQEADPESKFTDDKESPREEHLWKGQERCREKRSQVRTNTSLSQTPCGTLELGGPSCLVPNWGQMTRPLLCRSVRHWAWATPGRTCPWARWLSAAEVSLEGYLPTALGKGSGQ